MRPRDGDRNVLIPFVRSRDSAPATTIAGVAVTLSKPPGLPVFPPHADPAGDCLLARLLRQAPWRGAVAWPAGFEGGIAHRLDNATSGAVLAADSLEELARLRALFAGHRLRKTYVFLSEGEVAWRARSCDFPLAHHPRKKSRMVAWVAGQDEPAHRGKWYPAHSEFRHRRGRLWEVTITTGITHQIRVHAAVLGIPVLGDGLYGKPGRAGGAEVQRGNSEPARSRRGGFLLHHVGLAGPDGLRSDPVPEPEWVRQAADR